MRIVQRQVLKMSMGLDDAFDDLRVLKSIFVSTNNITNTVDVYPPRMILVLIYPVI